MYWRITQLILSVSLLLAAACGQAASAPTPTQPAVPTAAAPAGTDTLPAALSAGPLRDVPRNRTLVMIWWINSPIGAINPFNLTTYTHQEGNNLLWEGLAYYGVFTDQEIPWLAQSMTYNADFTELTIKLNRLAKWSDGVPVTAADLLFNFQSQLTNDQLSNHADFQQYVQGIRALDDHTVSLTFKLPAPRFKFEVLTLHFDNGMPIVPAHVLSHQADVTTYEGGLDMPHSGPYNLVYWDDKQKIYDLRPDWWAVPAGLIAAPAVQRVIFVNTNALGLDLDMYAQRVIDNEYDTSFDMRQGTIANVVQQNPKVTTHTGRSLPYGYVDWWPNSLWMNTQLAPYSDARVRRAISLAINRPQIDATLYQGAPVSTIYPFPLYPALQRFLYSPAVKVLEAKYQPGKFDLAESARLMTEAGFTKDADGLWEKDGQTVNATLSADPNFHADIAPLLVEMLKAGGFDAAVDFGPNNRSNAFDGKAGLTLWGHLASVVDPFATFQIYSTPHSTPSYAECCNYSRYSNPVFDALVAAMAPLSADDPKFQSLAVQAMEIYWRDTIDIPIIQWLHRIPYNQTYWTNWPTQDNPGLGVNGALWAETGMLVVTSLKAAQ